MLISNGNVYQSESMEQRPDCVLVIEFLVVAAIPVPNKLISLLMLLSQLM